MKWFKRKTSEEDVKCAEVSQDNISADEVVCDIDSADEKVVSFADKSLRCFGWSEEKTEKWLTRCVKIWYAIMLFLWFLLGAFTFAPVMFIRNEVNSIIKDKKMSLLIAILIYTLTLALILFAILI